MSHFVIYQDIHWLGDLLGIALAAFFIVTSKRENRALVASIMFMVSGYSSIPNVLRDTNTVAVCYQAFWLLLAIIWTPIFLRELPPAVYRWWHGQKEMHAARQRLREAKAARRAAEARLARAQKALAEAIEFGKEIDQATKDKAAGKPFYLMGRVYGHEEIREP